MDFTTNHAQVLEALSRIMGMDDAMPSRFNISDYEALTFENRSNPIVIQRLLYRVVRRHRSVDTCRTAIATWSRRP